MPIDRRDYLMKQIDQFGLVLGKLFADLLGYKTKGQVSVGIEMVDKTLKEELDLTIGDMISIPIDKFVSTLLEKNKFNTENFDRLADILLVMADDLYEKKEGDEKGKELYGKCLRIYEYLNETDLTYSYDRHFKIGKIKNIL